MALLAEGWLPASGTDAFCAPQQAQSRQNVGPQYHAFMSYSRAADGRLAPVLQSALQGLRLEKESLHEIPDRIIMGRADVANFNPSGDI